MKTGRNIDAPGIEEILVTHEERLEQLEKGRKVDLSIPADAINAAAKAIAEQVSAQIRITRCAPPEGKSLKKEFCDAILPVIENRIGSMRMTVRAEQTVKLEEELKDRLFKVTDEMESIRDNFDVHSRSWWENLWMRLSLGVSLTLIATLAISAVLYFNSATYWGRRYYNICHHPLQQNEVILAHKGDAYEFTMTMFSHSKESKHRFKLHIRDQEELLKTD